MRRIMTVVIFLAVAALSLAGTAVAAEPGRRPNLLVIVTDDQRWDELGVVQREQGERARYPFLETPNLDRLASQGMRFRNAFVVCSLCSPSRAAMLTGQYNHANGIIDNQTPFPADRASWATALRAAGYHTGYFGKWHHGNQVDRPGFDRVATFLGQGKYFGCQFIVDGEKVNTEGYVDERSVDFAIAFMEDRAADQPFAIQVGFKAVHGPFTPMQEHAKDYADDPIKVAANRDAVAIYRRDAVSDEPAEDAPPGGRHCRDILRTAKGIDRNVGRLLDALDRLELADDTLVIFTSDNGYYLNEHRLGDKRSAYDESLRVPLIVRLPGTVPAGVTCDAMALNIDIAPTLLATAGQGVPAAMHGKAWQPLFADTDAPWRDAFLYEYWQEKKYPQTPTILAVRTATHKLVTYPGHEGWTELFDLQADPYEITNLVGDPASAELLAAMRKRLEGLKQETGYLAEPPVPKKGKRRGKKR